MTAKSLREGFSLRPYSKPDSGWVASAHIAHYRFVERFDLSFDAAVSCALEDIDNRIGHDRTIGLILQGSDGARCGSIFTCDMDTAARIRLFFLDRGLHGRRLGRAMLDAALDAVRETGFRRIEVCTFDAHAAACRLYSKAGFVERARTPCTAFGRRMVQVDFACEFVAL